MIAIKKLHKETLVCKSVRQIDRKKFIFRSIHRPMNSQVWQKELVSWVQLKLQIRIVITTVPSKNLTKPSELCLKLTKIWKKVTFVDLTNLWPFLWKTRGDFRALVWAKSSCSNNSGWSRSWRALGRRQCASRMRFLTKRGPKSSHISRQVWLKFCSSCASEDFTKLSNQPRNLCKFLNSFTTRSPLCTFIRC